MVLSGAVVCIVQPVRRAGHLMHARILTEHPQGGKSSGYPNHPVAACGLIVLPTLHPH